MNKQELEIWKDTHLYEGIYQVSNYGRNIKSWKRRLMWIGNMLMVFIT